MNDETTPSNNIPSTPEGITPIISDDGIVKGGNILPTFVAPPPPPAPTSNETT